MKFNLFMALLFGSLLSMHAQNSGSISGKVIDSKTKETIPYVTITVKENGTVVTGGITDDYGNFSVKSLALKQYTVELQFIGYKTRSIPTSLTTTDKAVSLGTIVLEEDATELEEVSVVKEVTTIEQKLDRKVITVGRDLTTAGGTAAEIMNNIPSVNVDQDGNISLRGNQNVRILVDGRPTNIDPAQLLKQIPSSSIKKIELITNPSAKYNPEGMSGIINIVLHKNANDGFNGNFNAGINFGETPKFNNSLDLNYRKGKVNFFGNLGSNFGKQFNGGEVDRYGRIRSTQFIDVVNNNEGILGKIGMDYYINDNNTISVYTNQNYFQGDATIRTDILYARGTGLGDITQISELTGDNHNNTYNFAFKHKFEKEGHTLDLEANYNDSQETQQVEYTTTQELTTTVYNDDLIDERQNGTINLDYVNPLSEKSNLELGAEARIIRSDNVYNTTRFAENSALNNSVYTYDMDIYSAYATFGQKFEKISYQLGARFESYKVNANFNNGQSTFKDDYITVYPSAYLTYNLNEKNMFQLSYSRRVDRPSLDQTKPIREFSTPLVTSLGNPELEPQFTNSIELNYTKMVGEGSSFTAGVFYRLINDEISRILYPDETTANTQDQIMSFDNYDNNSAFGFELSSNYKITKWWDVQPAIDYSLISQRGMVSVLVPGSEEDFEPVLKDVDVSAFNARLNSNFRVNQRLSFLFFGFYRGAVDGIQNNGREMYKIDAGGRYTLLDGKMSLSLRFNDIFNTMRYSFTSENPFVQQGTFRWESQTVYFALNYRFGGGKNKALERKQRDDNTKQAGGGMF